MSATDTNELLTEVNQSIDIDRPADVVFQGLIRKLTDLNTGGNHAAMPMVLEEWPGGRWYRDLGNNTGHNWGHVQSIKPPHLIEIYGPMFMSFAVASNLIIRIAETDSGCAMTLRHQILGFIPEMYRSGVGDGWRVTLEGVKALVSE